MKKRNNLGFKIGIMLLLAVLSLVIVAVLYAILSNNFKLTLEGFFHAFKTGTFWMLYGVIVALLALYFAFDFRGNSKKAVVKDNDGEKSHLLTLHEMKKSNDFVVTDFDNIGNANDGIILMAEKRRKILRVVMLKKPCHVLVIGTTGSGKTTIFMNPTIQLLSRTKTKPTMIISDPKGELYDTHSLKLKELGYNVQLIDLRSPYQSIKWNPFYILQERLDTIKELSSIPDDGAEEWIMKEDARVKIQILKDEVYENAKDLVEAICPIESSTDPSWQKDARSLINAIVLAFCEDYLVDEIDSNKLNFASLYYTIVNYAGGDCAKLKNYLIDSRSTTSKVKGLAKAVMEATSDTLSSYLTNVNSYAEWLSDSGILSMTSENEVNLYGYDDEPTTLFIRVPDDKQTRHRLVTLLITQVYKCLVEKAERNKLAGLCKDEASLKRTVYLLLDEFGNLPKFNNLESMITVGRSRKIFFEMIVQSNSQLINKYGKDVADIVKGNCNAKIFLGSDDSATIDDFVKLCGKKVVASTSMSASVEKSDVSSSTSTKEIPLIYPSEFATLNNGDNRGNAVVSVYGHEAFKSKYTPSYEIQDIYELKKGEAIPPRAPKIFIEEDFIYDINTLLERKESIEKELKALKASMIKESNELMAEEEYVNKNKQELTSALDNINNKIRTLSKIINSEECVKLEKASIGEKLEILERVISTTSDTSVLFKLFDIKQQITKCVEMIKTQKKGV